MVAAQHMESQVALYLIVSLPPPPPPPQPPLPPPPPHLKLQIKRVYFVFIVFSSPWHFHIAYLCVHSLADLLYL